MFNFKEKLYYLFALPLFYIGKHLFGIITSSSQSIFAELFNFVAALALCLAISFGSYFLFKIRLQRVNAALLAALVFVFIFFFQDIFLFFMEVQTGNVRIRWMIPMVGLVTLAVAIVIIRSRRELFRINEYLNLVSFAFLGYLLFELIFSFSSLHPKRIEYNAPAYAKTCTDCPDIYFFLLDSYTSNASLEKYFDFSNSKFTNELRDLGFTVKDQEASGYLNTVPSMASTFNLANVDSLGEYYKGDLLQLVKTSLTARTLRSWGYEVKNFSLFDILDQKRFYTITYEVKPHFVNMVFQSTVFHWLFEYFGTDSNMYSTHKAVLSNAVQVAEVPHDRPMFVYSHVLSPHPPFVIDSLGNEIPFTKQGGKSNKQAYVNQIIGLNNMVFEAVKKIRTASPNAIVVIQGDHGFRLLIGPESTDEAYTVFLAYFGPNSNGVIEQKSANEIFRTILGALGRG
ncbi:MAG: sulfatase-like hydrolase/transferase [Bacteroidota bacterium]